MNCPKCQAEVAAGHFYCSNCRTMIENYTGEEEGEQRGLVARVGTIVLNLLLLAFIIAGSIIVARQINWQELINQIKGKTESRVKAERAENRSRGGASASRQVDQPVAAPSPSATQQSQLQARPTGIESVRALSQKIEELPTLEEAAKNSSHQPGQTGIESAREPDAISNAPAAKNSPALPAEQIDARLHQHGGDAGFVTITSYVAARIYVDGQFSGVTPRTVKLTSGDHQIRLIADGYEDWTRRVRLKSNQQVGLMASMKKKLAP